MARIDITNTFVVDASADRLWEVMVGEFQDVARWASGLDASGPNPHVDDRAAPEGIDAAGRSCVVPGLGQTDERLNVFDPEGYRFSYTVDAEKVPSFVSGMENTWTFRALGPDRTEVRQALTAEAHGVLGAAMKPLLQRQFRSLLSNLQEDLTVYATTGDVSSRKRSELAVAG